MSRLVYKQGGGGGGIKAGSWKSLPVSRVHSAHVNRSEGAMGILEGQMS